MTQQGSVNKTHRNAATRGAKPKNQNLQNREELECWKYKTETITLEVIAINKPKNNSNHNNSNTNSKTLGH